jgi:uncharacterized Zn finger protein
MADIIHIGEPITLCCDKCGGDTLHVLIADWPARVIVECAGCGHRITMGVDNG